MLEAAQWGVDTHRVNAASEMRRTFFKGALWMALGAISGFGAVISYSEAGRIGGAGQVVAVILVVLLSPLALFAFVKGRLILWKARDIAFAGTLSRRLKRSSQGSELGVYEPPASGRERSGTIHQLSGAQDRIASMRVVCRTREPVSSFAQRLDLELEPLEALFTRGEGALVETSATGIGLVLFGPGQSHETTLFASDQATWGEVLHEVDALSVTSPEWLADPSEFPE